jgi:hypothetical protein
MLVAMACSDIYIGIIFFYSILQEQIDTVIVEGVENVGEEDWIEIREDDRIEIKTEKDYIQLVGRVKCEQEVSVLCCVFGGGDLCTGECVVLYIVFTYALFSYLHIT